MKHKSLILIFCLIISGCLSNQSPEKTQFQSFIKHLDKIETPISFNSNNEYNLKVQYPKDDPFFIKIQNEYAGFGVFGLLYETKDFIAILGNIATDTGTPIIITYDKNGTKIDTHAVYENVMGDIGIYVHNFGTLLPNMQIEFVDSTITRKLTDDGSDEIPGTDSLSVKTKKYKIDNSGKFIRTE